MVTMRMRGAARLVVAAGAVAVLATCGSSATPAHQGLARGTVVGRVMAGPTCPVQRVGVPCPSRPIVAEVQARAAGTVVASTRSGRDGTYRLRLPAGTYTLSAVIPHLFPRCTPRNVTLTAARTTGGNLMCDTGIR